jgi:hypothetical protein
MQRQEPGKWFELLGISRWGIASTGWILAGTRPDDMPAGMVFKPKIIAFARHHITRGKIKAPSGLQNRRCAFSVIAVRATADQTSTKLYRRRHAAGAPSAPPTPDCFVASKQQKNRPDYW